jgi:hypothetical protein
LIATGLFFSCFENEDPGSRLFPPSITSVTPDVAYQFNGSTDITITGVNLNGSNPEVRLVNEGTLTVIYEASNVSPNTDGTSVTATIDAAILPVAVYDLVVETNGLETTLDDALTIGVSQVISTFFGNTGNTGGDISIEYSFTSGPNFIAVHDPTNPAGDVVNLPEGIVNAAIKTFEYLNGSSNRIVLTYGGTTDVDVITGASRLESTTIPVSAP